MVTTLETSTNTGY